MVAELHPISFTEAAYALELYEREQPQEQVFKVRLPRRIKDHVLIEPETIEGKVMVGILGVVEVHVTTFELLVHGWQLGPLPMVLNPVAHIETILPFMHELVPSLDIGDPTEHRFRTLEIV